MIICVKAEVKKETDVDAMDKVMREAIDRTVKRKRFIRKPKEYRFINEFIPEYKMTVRGLYCCIREGGTEEEWTKLRLHFLEYNENKSTTKN